MLLPENLKPSALVYVVRSVRLLIFHLAVLFACVCLSPFALFPLCGCHIAFLPVLFSPFAAVTMPFFLWLCPSA